MKTFLPPPSFILDSNCCCRLRRETALRGENLSGKDFGGLLLRAVISTMESVVVEYVRKKEDCRNSMVLVMNSYWFEES